MALTTTQYLAAHSWDSLCRSNGQAGDHPGCQVLEPDSVTIQQARRQIVLTVGVRSGDLQPDRVLLRGVLAESVPQENASTARALPELVLAASAPPRAVQAETVVLTQ